MAYQTLTFDSATVSCKRTKTPRELSAPFADGYQQVAGDGINPFSEQWDISAVDTKANITSIRDFLDARIDAGPNDKFFYWTALDESSAKTWKLDGAYSQESLGNDTRRISFKVSRVWVG